MLNSFLPYNYAGRVRVSIFILIVNCLFLFSCKEENTDNTRIALMPFAIENNLNSLYWSYFSIKDVATATQNPKDYRVYAKADSLIKPTINFKAGKYSLILLSEHVSNTFEKADKKEFHSDDFTDSILKYMYLTKKLYLDKGLPSDSIKLLHLTVALQEWIMNSYTGKVGIKGCGGIYFNTFSSRNSYRAGDTVSIAGTIDKTDFWKNADYKLKDNNTKVIHLKTKEELKYSIRYVGPIVTLQFVAPYSGEYQVYSEIKYTHQNEFFGTLNDTIHVE